MAEKILFPDLFRFGLLKKCYAMFGDVFRAGLILLAENEPTEPLSKKVLNIQFWWCSSLKRKKCAAKRQVRNEVYWCARNASDNGKWKFPREIIFVISIYRRRQKKSNKNFLI